MIVVDRALEERARAGPPIAVGIVGAGFLGRALVEQIHRHVPGMRVAALANRRLAPAHDAALEAGMERIETVDTLPALEAAVAAGRCPVTEDAALLCRADGIDAVIEATGSVSFGADVALEAIQHGKHVVTNAELDATLGPALKTYADRAGIVFTGIDGDQPGVEMNLYRFVRGLGMRPLLCGNIKTLMDHYRTPATQEAFARRWGQRPSMVTSFVDGTKISFEQAEVANATGMSVARRGMVGYEFGGYVDDPAHLDVYDVDELLELDGIVDYALGAKPGAGVYVLAYHEDPGQHRYLELYKMGEGPLYCFYAPHHLAHLEAPWTVARAVLFGDAAVTPSAGLVVDVVATAKQELSAGTVVDGIGGYFAYGQCENADVADTEGLLPIGVAEGCRLRRDVQRDQVLRYDDVELPAGRLCDRLREEQRAHIARSRRRAAA